ncbi:ParB/RepB/Spo0J family partition protein [Nocardia transvalensis]|uniref:ParB/RepB/Spo0J family partition protein n=1 Tax=Nocardia transvalensis TaxID=37333 RepID=UPI0018938FE5|nr:ParB/RepB/Spo0J family partition protein [Nocardia transvalensis]MBF6333052.1 ParB-like nuclease domain-containing protein [Nocardia transvalensis]
MPIEMIRGAEDLRVKGEDSEHAKVLAEIEDELPPILVHRQTMRIIDGRHRLKAAEFKGATCIAVKFFDGPASEAFVLAVELNISHGLPLSLADRKAAAYRIARMYPEWSDRRIAAVAGLSHKTVGAMRHRSCGEIPQLTKRLGRDGRMRMLRNRTRRDDPGDPASGNAPAGAVEAVPDARSLPAVARLAGLRARRRGAGAARRADVDMALVVRNLRADPSLRFTDVGRTLLRWLDGCPQTPEEIGQLAEKVPEHWLELITQLASRNADNWQDFAAVLDRRKHTRPAAESG